MCVAAVLFPALAHAYIGPGAGIALLATAATLFISLLIAIAGVLLWPFRQIYRLLTRRRPPKAARIQRAIVIGLDGLDPDLVQRWMSEGKLPSMARIARAGVFEKLATTFPSISPVAWSSFATGVNPGKHGIYDFLTRNPKTYLPELSSSKVSAPPRSLRLGPYRIPLGGARLKLLRKSAPFWSVMARYRIPCSILRVPITFPPDQFDGTMLSAMCVPDLQGSQGSFSHYATTATAPATGRSIGGQNIVVEIKDDRIEAQLEGPENPIKPRHTLRVPFSVDLDRESNLGTLRIGRQQISLPVGRFSDWVTIEFSLGLGLTLRGMCRFRLMEMSPRFRLYVSPINIDPSDPALPISQPFLFSIFLAKLIGRFATLGMAEDTWALNEGVLDEEAFLEQAWDTHQERESMFFEMLKRTPTGVLACVFDGTDRIQHMFMRYLDPDHPDGKAPAGRFHKTIEDTYIRMDQMIGRVLERVDLDDPATLLIVMSDHGFKNFRRGVNLNSWLYQNGYLQLKAERTASGEWFEAVDWSHSRAFALGLGGIFLNVKNRESQGIVEPGAPARALAEEIAAKLSGLTDPESSTVAIREVFPAHKIYKGPYREDALDVIVGYAAGWRASWDGARGCVDGEVFSDNSKAWSGDHCIDPRLVPGVLISNHKLHAESGAPSIMDVAPTLLELFGIPAPNYMDGKSLA